MRQFLAMAILAPGLAVADCTKDAMLVFDASSSMAITMTEPGRPSRITEALEALRTALPDLASVRNVGLITYGPGATTGCGEVTLQSLPQPRAAAAILSTLESVRPGGNTPLTEAVALSARVLADRAGGDVVLITDGEESCGGQPCEAASQIAQLVPGVTVHVIGFRLRQNLLDQNLDIFDNAPLGGAGGAECLAERTGGLYVTTETIDQLVKALRRTLGCPATS